MLSDSGVWFCGLCVRDVKKPEDIVKYFQTKEQLDEHQKIEHSKGQNKELEEKYEQGVQKGLDMAADFLYAEANKREAERNGYNFYVAEFVRKLGGKVEELKNENTSVSS